MKCKQCETHLLGMILYDDKKEICNACFMKDWAERSLLAKQYAERLENGAKAQQEYLNMVKIIDYKDTGKLLEALNQMLLTGVEVDDVIHYLDAIAKISKKY